MFEARHVETATDDDLVEYAENSNAASDELLPIILKRYEELLKKYKDCKKYGG